MNPKRLRVYLDHLNGGAPHPQVVAAMTEAISRGANPSSLHGEGRRAAQMVETARGQVAALIGARSEEVIFTSSGTEANAFALGGVAKAYESQGRHLVVSAIEHLSVLQEVRRMERQGWRVTVLSVDHHGWVDPETLEPALTPETVLVSIQWASPEVGTIQPMAELVRRVKTHGILFHTDAVAAAGQVPIDLRAIPVDALSLAANTFGGPAGVGALFVRKGARILPLFVGGAQEEGRRAGTENLVGIVGMGQAAALAKEALPALSSRLTPLRDRLIRGIVGMIPEASLNGDPTERLPGQVSMSFDGADAEALVLALDMEGIAVGLGSACTAQTMKASHVLKAMGVEESRALGTVTFTLGPQTHEDEIDRVLEILPRIVDRGARHLVEKVAP